MKYLSKLFSLLILWTFCMGCTKHGESDVLIPIVDTIAPNVGSAGDQINIIGSNFSTKIKDNVVIFGVGQPAVVTAATPTRLTVTIPEASDGAWVLMLRVKNSQTIRAGLVTIVSLPTITSMSPVTGPAGTQITLNGTNFSSTISDNVVKINGVDATIQKVSDTRLTAVIPPGATSGPVTLTVRGKNATMIAGSNFNNFKIVPASEFGTPGQAYDISSTVSFDYANAIDTDGNLWGINSKDGQIYQLSYKDGSVLKKVSIADIGFDNTLSSYGGVGITRDSNGRLHAYIAGASSTGSKAYVVSITNTGVVTKDFATVLLGSSGLTAHDFVILSTGEVLTTNGTGYSTDDNDLVRLNTNGTYDIYYEGARARDLVVEGKELYVLRYFRGVPTHVLIEFYKLDHNKVKTTIGFPYSAHNASSVNYVNGPLNSAVFWQLEAFTMANGDIYTGESYNQLIRKVDLHTSTLEVTKIAGIDPYTPFPRPFQVFTGSFDNVTLPMITSLLYDDKHKVMYAFGFDGKITRLALN
ncbi:IPT/TIG domain-containing protein [Mucilaginibacter rubeus]|uniref:IPT/TIG domain-containing protein n=1 Tax=Mucilaginibacter rubeus TaxID=2027860 RepID=UPI0016658C65|nr:IPT/TIG domain-containing protein [Mucilaginibacter rubeus]GGA88881.1 hypothetical protein GCM10011500_00630 [Mucilaginibacter rubeus]